jgi:hypothetical protein
MMKITINIQEELGLKLKQFVSPRKVSQFISDSIRKELENKENALLLAYKEAYSDSDREQEVEEWDVLNNKTIIS